MAFYREKSPHSPAEDIMVIEDSNMCRVDENGNDIPDFEFIDDQTVRAHPLIIDLLLEAEEAERIWTMDEMLAELN